MLYSSAPRLNVDAIKHGNEQVDNEHIGAEQVYGHHNGGDPPAVYNMLSRLFNIFQ